MKNRIRLDTLTDAYKFVEIASALSNTDVYITNGKGLKVSAKSILGAVYSLEFDELFVESNKDIYSHIKEFIID